MYLKVISYFLLCVLMILIVSFQSDKNVLLWQEGKLLTWEDFKGKPEKRFAAASTHYDILKSVEPLPQKKINVKIEAVFFRHKSWKNKNWINEEVLEHEQKHFDIVELFARRLRKAIYEFKFKNFNHLTSSVDSLYTIYDKEMDKYQDRYDEESDGSMNGAKQREWEKKIMSEIAGLKEFEKTSLEIELK